MFAHRRQLYDREPENLYHPHDEASLLLKEGALIAFLPFLPVVHLHSADSIGSQAAGRILSIT